MEEDGGEGTDLFKVFALHADGGIASVGPDGFDVGGIAVWWGWLRGYPVGDGLVLIGLENVGYEVDDMERGWRRVRRECGWDGFVTGGLVPGLGKEKFVTTENWAGGVCRVGMFGEQLETEGGVAVGAVGDVGLMHAAERRERG